MCTGKCAECVGCALYPLAIFAILANILLYFPNGQIMDSDKITDYVWYFHGIIGAGCLMFLPACSLMAAGGDGCCANRCGMLLSIIMAVVGIGGALYCAIVSSLALAYGPLCDTGDGKYRYPFRNITENNYLLNETSWSVCKKPENVVMWNIIFFFILLVISAIEAILCCLQIINGLFGFLFGTGVGAQRLSSNRPSSPTRGQDSPKKKSNVQTEEADSSKSKPGKSQQESLQV